MEVVCLAYDCHWLPALVSRLPPSQSFQSLTLSLPNLFEGEATIANVADLLRVSARIFTTTRLRSICIYIPYSPGPVTLRLLCGVRCALLRLCQNHDHGSPSQEDDCDYLEEWEERPLQLTFGLAWDDDDAWGLHEIDACIGNTHMTVLLGTARKDGPCDRPDTDSGIAAQISFYSHETM